MHKHKAAMRRQILAFALAAAVAGAASENFIMKKIGDGQCSSKELKDGKSLKSYTIPDVDESDCQTSAAAMTTCSDYCAEDEHCIGSDHWCIKMEDTQDSKYKSQCHLYGDGISKNSFQNNDDDDGYVHAATINDIGDTQADVRQVGGGTYVDALVTCHAKQSSGSSAVSGDANDSVAVSSSSDSTAITLGVVGGVLGLAAIVALAYFIRKRAQTRYSSVPSVPKNNGAARIL